MPYFSHRILVSLCPLVNLDLFKKGYYHIKIRLVDLKSEQTLSRVECLEIKDLFGGLGLNAFSYPGSCHGGDHFITQTILVEYTEQFFLLGEYYLFKLDCPVRSDHTDGYLPSHLSLNLDLMYSGEDELPSDPSTFTSVSSRHLTFTIDWRKGLHSHFPVLFDYFHMAALGVTLHASLLEFCLDDFHFDPSGFSSSRRRSMRGSVSGRKRSSSSSSQASQPMFPNIHSILFGNPPAPSPSSLRPSRSLSLPGDTRSARSRQALYAVPDKDVEHIQDLHQTSLKQVKDRPPHPPHHPHQLVKQESSPHQKVRRARDTHQQIKRAQDAHLMLCDMLRSARDSLHIGYSIMSKDSSDVEPSPDVCNLTQASSLQEAERLCSTTISQLNTCLSDSWEWFCLSAVVRPEMISYLANSTHRLRMQYFYETLVSRDHHLFTSPTSISDPANQSLVASQIRKCLTIPMAFYTKENIETSQNSTVVFVEGPLWPVLEEEQSARPQVTMAEEGEGGRSLDFSEALPYCNGEPATPGSPSHDLHELASPVSPDAAHDSQWLIIPKSPTITLQGLTNFVHPYLINYLPQSNRGPGGRGRERRHGIHLVVCVHGLQGNQFDLRLYRIFLTMALPQVRIDFLMASSNQSNTFCDFNTMTDLLLAEVLQHVGDMATPPSKISFIGHSLGSIIVRSLVTRQEFAPFLPKLHLYLSICGPHLGTKYQNGIVSVGMWAVRKWYNSKSLQQLSLKDAPNPRDAFLFQLSEAPSLEYFRHVVLMASPQDKYVPYHSAKIATLPHDPTFQSSVNIQMMQNILEPLRKGRVNVVRLSVDHSIPTSANSVIGRAAHIAMLDNELFIEKLVALHLSQYFIEP